MGMNILQDLYSRMITSLGVEGIRIPLAAVKFYKNDSSLPECVSANEPSDISITCCQAIKHAELGDAVLLSKENIGCIAAAISLGLVDKDDERPLKNPRVYTEIMREQSGLGGDFVPPAPRDFTDGTVYACKDSGHAEYGLFGGNDSGRFKDLETARLAIKGMMAIQPAVTRGVFVYSPDFNEFDIVPDIIVMTVRPVELARIVQAYQYMTGRQVNACMSAVRAVDSDLIVRPYLTQEINISTFCVGARLIAGFEADKIGIGIPFNHFTEIVSGMEDSRSGYPFHLYPGASERP